MKRARLARLNHLAAGGLATTLALTTLGCATPPRPRELDAYDALKQGSNTQEAAKRAPDLVASSDSYGTKATQEWQSNDLAFTVQMASFHPTFTGRFEVRRIFLRIYC